MRFPIFAVTVLALAACSNAPPAMPTQPFTKPGVSMKLDPPSAPDCKPNTVYRGMLEWSVSGVDTPKTEVRMETPEGSIFARSNDHKAHAETGDWIKPGMWFLLFNRKSGEMLGALQAGPTPCP